MASQFLHRRIDIRISEADRSIWRRSRTRDAGQQALLTTRETGETREIKKRKKIGW
jgi:hypothetical protein